MYSWSCGIVQQGIATDLAGFAAAAAVEQQPGVT
jgi:hypothetical protein